MAPTITTITASTKNTPNPMYIGRPYRPVLESYACRPGTPDPSSRIRELATSGTMSLAAIAGLHLHDASHRLQGSTMTATYTFDVFSSLDGFGAARGNWS